MAKAKRIIVSVTTDLSTDQRVQKTCSSLSEAGYVVQLVGRKLPNSLSLPKQKFAQKRLNLIFKKGFLFYAFFNLKLFFYLLFKRSDLLWSNDLDTLPANYLVSRLKRVRMIYDSHEYFTEVPELASRPTVKAIWKKIEASILPLCQYGITVSDHIAEYYEKEYGLKMTLVRNFPKKNVPVSVEKKPQIIYQGALNKGRGLEMLINAMQFVEEGISLILVGSGDEEFKLRKMVRELNLGNSVKFMGRKNPQELKKITAESALGVSLEEELSLNYKYALPNKVFDYLQAGIPVLYSDLIEVKKLLANYDVGEQLKSRAPKALAEQLNRMMHSDKKEHWQKEALRASEEYNWEKEERKLFAVVNEALS